MGSCASKPTNAVKVTAPSQQEVALLRATITPDMARSDSLSPVSLGDMPRSTLSNGMHFANVLDAPPLMRSSKRCFELAPHFESNRAAANPLSATSVAPPASGVCTSERRRRVNFLPRVTVLDDVWSADSNSLPKRRRDLMTIDGADCGPHSTASGNMTFLTDALTHRGQLALHRPKRTQRSIDSLQTVC